MIIPEYNTVTCIPVRGTYAQGRAHISFLPFSVDTGPFGLGSGEDLCRLTVSGNLWHYGRDI